MPTRSIRALVAFLATLLVASLLAVVPFAAPAAAASTVETDVARWINGYRVQHGLPPLKVDVGLSNDARAWSYRAASAGGGISHDPGSWSSCAQIPGREWCGENVGWDASAGAVQTRFEQSSGHRANLLCNCSHLGIGIVSNGTRTYVTQRFVRGSGGLTSYPATSASRAFVRNVYADFLGRSPSSRELSYWSTHISGSNAVSRQVFVDLLAYSDEWVGRLVDRYYRVALGRSADPRGKAHWTAVIRQRKMTPAQVAATFYASPEYFTRSGSSVSAWVTDLYRELLGRDPDKQRSYWIDTTHRRGRTAVAGAFYGSTESLAVRVDRLYRDLLGRRADRSGRSYWSGVIARSGNDVDVAIYLAASPEYYR